MKKSSPKTALKAVVYLSLGSNIDDRLYYLDAAREKIIYHQKIDLLDQSKIYETEPWIEGEHPHAHFGSNWFLNQVLKIKTSLKPMELLNTLESIEKNLGRSLKNTLRPRTIDIDILLYGEEIVDLPELKIPHQHMNNRQFILVPLAEIAPNLKDPVTQTKYRNMLKKAGDNNKVIPFF
jgi:2-amino-4-hydroxy-6-hydroxymethyldihydropteridine diphosphokinase